MSNREQVVLNDRYELQRRVGRGGMAEVFLARDRLLDRPVAIKILFPEFATDPSFVARFKREAQAAANLNHPNIVGVYDWGRERGTYYIVMEYVDGRTVSELLRTDGPFPAPQAARIAADVAAALGFAHQKGVVHRDVKPGNVLITRTGEVKVADFGIARAMTGGAEENLTQTGSVMGTATYFSPEQAQGKPVDPRTDLYSLGVVLYEMASGKPPYTADSPVAIAYKHVQEPLPPLKDRVRDVPDAYVAITEMALAKNPDKRYQDAKALRSDLLRFVQNKPVSATRNRPSGSTGAAAAVGATTGTRTPPRGGPAVAGRGDRRVDDEPPRRTGWFFAAVIGLLVVLAGLLFLFARELGIFDDSGDQVKVIDQVGQNYLDAEAELRGLGFDVVLTPVESEAEEGRVLSQDPEGGTLVDEGSTVELTYSELTETLALPDVQGELIETAEARLRREGFDNVNPTPRETTNEDEIGRVISQDPLAGDYAPDVEITLVYGTAPATTTTEAPPETTVTTSPPTTVTVPPTVPTTVPTTTSTTTTTTTTSTTTTTPTTPEGGM